MLSRVGSLCVDWVCFGAADVSVLCVCVSGMVVEPADEVEGAANCDPGEVVACVRVLTFGGDFDCCCECTECRSVEYFGSVVSCAVCVCTNCSVGYRVEVEDDVCWVSVSGVGVDVREESGVVHVE